MQTCVDVRLCSQKVPNYPNMDPVRLCDEMNRFIDLINTAKWNLCATTSEGDVTPCHALEEAIDLDPILQHYNGALNRKDVSDVKLCLRRHAVLVPLRKNDRDMAKVTSFYIHSCWYHCSLRDQSIPIQQNNKKFHNKV